MEVLSDAEDRRRRRSLHRAGGGAAWDDTGEDIAGLAVRGGARVRSAKERHGLAAVESLHAGVFMVVQRFRSDLGLFVHLHGLITDGAFEERGGEVRFLLAATPTPERLTAVLAQVHKAVAVAAEGDDLDLDPPLAAVTAFGMHPLRRDVATPAHGTPSVGTPHLRVN